MWDFTNVFSYYVNLDSQNTLKILDKNGKGFILDGSSNSVPVYTDGNNTYNLRYVVESYSSGTNWYRLYNDGWLEQGGVHPYSGVSNHYRVVFPKPFTDTNYHISKTNRYYQDSTNNARCFNFYSRNTTYADTWDADTNNSGNGFSWMACGYSA